MIKCKVVSPTGYHNDSFYKLGETVVWTPLKSEKLKDVAIREQLPPALEPVDADAFDVFCENYNAKGKQKEDPALGNEGGNPKVKGKG